MRNATIDGMKGVGIILVVIYHAISVNVPGARETFSNGLYNVIAAFFMQLFMVVSGYLAAGKAQDRQWLTARAIKCLVPALVFTVIFWVVSRFYPAVIVTYDLPLHLYLGFNLLIGFNGLVVWYLWTLMLCYGLAYGLEHLTKKIPFLVLTIGALLALNLIPVDFMGLGFLRWYGVFFFIGYLLGKYDLSEYKNAVYPALAIFPVHAYLYDWMKPYESVTYGMTGYTNLFNALTHGQFSLVSAMVIMAIGGVCFVYALVRVFNRIGIAQKTLAYLGQSSIGVFLLHYFFVGIFHNVIVSVIFSLGISLALYEGLKRVKVMNFVLFGGTDIPVRLGEAWSS